MGVGRMAFRGRERLVTLRVRGDAIVAQVLLWPDEVRTADGLVELARSRVGRSCGWPRP
ncbi:hypothetical protein AB0G85_32440 [Streptomyces sioyaensis]